MSIQNQHDTKSTDEPYISIAPKPSARFTSSGNNLFLAWSQNSKYLASINKNDILTVFDVVAGKTVTSMKFEYEVSYVEEFIWQLIWKLMSCLFSR